MKTYILVAVLVVLFACIAPQFTAPRAHAQDPPPPFDNLEDFHAALNTAVQAGDIESFWERVVAAGQMPLIFDTTAVFLYRGAAESVVWQGGFSGWEAKPEFTGTRQSHTDLWLMQHEFPLDTRLNYEILLDGNKGILDPLNPYEEDTGLGFASELRMPGWEPSPATFPRDDIAQGTLSDDIRIDSHKLGYAVNYRVYIPAGHEQRAALPTIYVMDGQWYLDPQKGNMLTVLDNLIAEGLIEPVIAVFIDPRDPDHLNENRRQDEYNANLSYAAFVTTELVPAIDAAYPTDPAPDARAILGTSIGGLNAAYFGLTRSDTFHLIGIQSPAFQLISWMLPEYENATDLPLKIFMSVGTVWDGFHYARQMRDIMEQQGYPLLYVEVTDEHAWGNWRNLLDDLLIYFFPPE